MNDEINYSSKVTLHLSIDLPEGTEAFSTFDEEPVSFRMGDGALRQGMELAITGLHPGDKQTITLTAEQGYGDHDKALIHKLPLSDFSEDLHPEVGQIIGFNLPSGEETAGAILDMNDSTATVDFNHPLAGKEIIFKVEILLVDNG